MTQHATLRDSPIGSWQLADSSLQLSIASRIHRFGNGREKAGQRFMTATAYPYYSLENAKLEHGTSCEGRLELLRDGSDDRDQAFSTRGFLSPELTRRYGYSNQLDVVYPGCLPDAQNVCYALVVDCPLVQKHRWIINPES